MTKNQVSKVLRKVIGFFLDLFMIEIEIDYNAITHHYKKMDDLTYIRISNKIENFKECGLISDKYFWDSVSFVDLVYEVNNNILPSYINNHLLQGIFIERIWEKKSCKERGFTSCFAFNIAIRLLRLLTPMEAVTITAEGAFGKEDEYIKKLEAFKEKGVIMTENGEVRIEELWEETKKQAPHNEVISCTDKTILVETNGGKLERVPIIKIRSSARKKVKQHTKKVKK